MTIRRLVSDGAKMHIRSVCAKFGLEIGAFAGSFADHRARILSEADVATIWDIGAHVGQYARKTRDAGYRRRIVSVEPAAGAFRELARRARRDPAWTAICAALSDGEGEQILNIARNGQSSSLLAMHPRHVTADPTSRYVATELVRVTTLDRLSERVSAATPFYVKVDVQGSELSALRGAITVLTKTAACEVELSLVELYNGGDEWRGVVDFLLEHGFTLCDMERVCFDNASRDLLQVNALFRKNAGE